MDIELVLNHLNVANQIDARLNSRREDWGINPTQMLVLALLQQTAGRRGTRARQAGASAAELAVRLQHSRSMISIQLKGLCKQGLVEELELNDQDDKRWRRYRVTVTGDETAKAVTLLLQTLSMRIKTLLSHAVAPAYKTALDTLLEQLPTAPIQTSLRKESNFREEMKRKRTRSTLKAKSGNAR